MFDPNLHHASNDDENNQLTNEVKGENELFSNNSRPTIHWGFVDEGECVGKEQINTDTDHFEALFARSNASFPPQSHHPRSYSSSSPTAAQSFLTATPPTHLYATSQPLLSSNSTKQKQSNEIIDETNRRESISSSSPGKNQRSNSISAQTKRKNFSLTHTSPTFLQASNSQNEPLEPLARSCSYKRPQSIKKYRRKTKEIEKEQQQYFSTRKYSTVTSANTQISQANTFDSSRKSLINPTGRISASELMATDDQNDQWSSPNSQRSGRVGSLPLDQLQIPTDGDEEIYRVRQFHTTSKGFVNRGDSFKRSFKRSGSISRRSSFRTSQNVATNEQTSPQEHDSNNQSSSLTTDARTSANSLTNASGINSNGVIDTHFIENNQISTINSLHDEEEEEEENHDDPLIERFQTPDGRVQDIHVYQVYLLGMSGTGKCSLLRQFKTTEYRGIYDYSSSVDDDPDNTVSIMLDGVESRLHIINIDMDHIKSSVTGDAYIIVYSITDRHSFQTAIQLIKNIRDTELINNQSSLKRSVPIILVGNKSDLVRKRSVTKETARHAALKHDCKFVETSAAINDKVDDLLAGTLKQIRINEQIRTEQKRRLTITNGSIDTNDSETPILANKLQRKNSHIHNRNSKSIFSKLFSVFRKKPLKVPSDVENLNTGI